VSILGNRVLRREDPKFLTTGGVYCDDLDGNGALWATYVRSTVAHGRIAELDIDEVRDRPGVVAVYTGADLDLPTLPVAMPLLPAGMVRPLLAKDVVRFVGEPVAVILTDDRYQGEDAAEAAFVDYEPLPAVIRPEQAIDSTDYLFPELGTNIAADLRVPADPDFFADCEVTVTQRVMNQRLAPCPMEPRSGLASWGEDGRLTQWACVQHPQAVRAALCEFYGYDPSDVRVIAPDVGGGFGAKIGLYAEEMLLPWLAKKHGRPVRWTETRSESMLGLGHGRAQTQTVTIGGDRHGKVLAYRLEVIQEAGAYPAIGAILPFLTGMMAPGTYDIPKVVTSSVAVVTNTTPTVAYRGAGRPEATAAIERAMDMFAAEIGMDPAEVRRVNLIHKDAFPHTTAAGATYDIGDYEKALDLALEASDYKGLREEQARLRDGGGTRQMGIGISTYVEITNGAGETGDFASVEILPGGKARVYTGSSPHGQGHITAWSMIAAEQLGIPMEDIEVIANDTDLVPKGGGTFGSRSLQSAGVAVHEASIALVDAARKLAADLLEANPEDIVLDKSTSRFHVAGTPTASKTWAELADSEGGAGLKIEHDSSPPGPTFPFGSHVAVVDLDTETGQVVLKRLLAVDDAGTILNPLLAEGQRHGGLAQGAAQALLEEVLYDDDGNPVTSNLADYAMISADVLPSFELVAMETPTPNNALGAKGIGESGTIGSTPAVQSAVVDALSHLGIRHVDMPATPQRVWTAIKEAQ
jgi:carbon-monoxide dehydrogenase large subunit